MEEKLFGVTSEQFGKNITKKFNYANKLHTSSIFVNKISLKYRIEHIEA